jgi:hypothetical protein
MCNSQRRWYCDKVEPARRRPFAERRFLRHHLLNRLIFVDVPDLLFDDIRQFERISRCARDQQEVIQVLPRQSDLGDPRRLITTLFKRGIENPWVTSGSCNRCGLVFSAC